jgi:hypothetical protein
VSFKEDGVSIAPNDDGAGHLHGGGIAAADCLGPRGYDFDSSPLKAKYTPMGFTGVPTFCCVKTPVDSSPECRRAFQKLLASG